MYLKFQLFQTKKNTDRTNREREIIIENKAMKIAFLFFSPFYNIICIYSFHFLYISYFTVNENESELLLRKKNFF